MIYIVDMIDIVDIIDIVEIVDIFEAIWIPRVSNLKNINQSMT